MNMVIRVAEADRARTWGFLVRHSPGTALANGTFIVSEDAARGLRDAGVDFLEISRDRQFVTPVGAAAGDRV